MLLLAFFERKLLLPRREGEALGLGTCMIGSVAPLLRYAPALKTKYKVRPDIKGGLVVLFGYPAIRYARGVWRTFANVDYA